MTSQTPPSRFACEICGKSIHDGIAVYRQNPPGEMPARWRCLAHHEPRVPSDPIVLDITTLIEESNT